MPEGGGETGEGKLKGTQTQTMFMVAHSHCPLPRLVSPTQELRPKASWCGPPRLGDGPWKHQDIGGIINSDRAGTQCAVSIKIQTEPAKVMLNLFQPFRHPTQRSTFGASTWSPC